MCTCVDKRRKISCRENVVVALMLLRFPGSRRIGLAYRANSRIQPKKSAAVCWVTKASECARYIAPPSAQNFLNHYKMLIELFLVNSNKKNDEMV